MKLRLVAALALLTLLAGVVFLAATAGPPPPSWNYPVPTPAPAPEAKP